MRDPEVGRFRKCFFELFRQRVNFGRKQKDDLKNLVPEGHPRVNIVFDFHDFTTAWHYTHGDVPVALCKAVITVTPSVTW